MKKEATYDIKPIWLFGLAFGEEEHVIRVAAHAPHEAREKAQPEIDELSKTYGKGPSLIGIERRRG